MFFRNFAKVFTRVRYIVKILHVTLYSSWALEVPWRFTDRSQYYTKCCKCMMTKCRFTCKESVLTFHVVQIWKLHQNWLVLPFGSVEGITHILHIFNITNTWRTQLYHKCGLGFWGFRVAWIWNKLLSLRSKTYT